MIIYHGSTNVIKKPELNKGKPYNDFGKGFYCTEEIEKAKEWACKDNIDGILNCYDLDISKLKILNLTLEKYNILNWISVLIHNRVFHVQNPISINGKKFLEDNYYIDTTKYDLVIGYRADGSYFSYAQNFLDNSLSLNNLEKALKLGNLGKQIVLVSKKSFSNIRFVNYERVDKAYYYKKFEENDKKARLDYKKLTNNKNDLYLIDLIRENK